MLLEKPNSDALGVLKSDFAQEPIREGDPVRLFTDSKEKINLNIWSYSPFGFEFRHTTGSEYGIGQHRTFTLLLGDQTLKAEGTVVAQTGDVVSVRSYFPPSEQYDPSKSRRENHRWLCPEVTLPTASAPNPVRFNDFIFFRVIDISSKGLKLATSMRNKLLAKGQVLETTFSIPSVGSVKSAIRVERIDAEEIDKKPVLVLGVSLIDPDQVTLSAFAEYLLAFAKDCTVRGLRNENFPVAQISRRLDFTYVKTLPEYEEVIELRYQAYLASGKLKEGVTKAFMRDEFDARARILVVKHNGKIVGSLRAMFHEAYAQTSHSRYVDCEKSLPPINSCLEVSRACLDPSYRGGDVFDELLAHLALVTIKGGRRYYFGSAAGMLVPLWESAGCQRLDINYTHETLGNLKHEMLLNDVHEAVLGRTLVAKQWNRLYGDLYEYCDRYQLIDPSPIDRAKIAFRRIFKG